MRITPGHQRAGASAFRTALRVCCALAALLVLSSAAAQAAETWAERLEKAREKYNEKTVHCYVSGQGRAQKGKVNVRFYRAKNSGINIKGTGLVLAIVKLICDRHNADIKFKSDIGKGTEFEVVMDATY